MTTSTLRRRAPFLFLLLAACLCIAATSCAGATARQTQTLPALRAAWAAIQVEALREAEAKLDAEGRQAVTVADAAITSGDVVKITTAPWPVVHALAEGDIQRRLSASLIGPGVAESLREELRLFAESRAVFTRSTP